MGIRFNKVVIRNISRQSNNIHLAVHPFAFTDDVIRHFEKRGDYIGGSHIIDKGDVIDWQKSLLDSLWDNIPGLHGVFFTNGNITLQHTGAFDDEDIVAEATEIIKPYLERELHLREMFDN